MFEPLRAGVYAIILVIGSVTIANTPAPYQEHKVVSVAQVDETTMCYRVENSQARICYKIELPEPKVEVATSPQPVSTPVAQSYENGDVEKLIREVFGSDADRALEIAYCESGLNPQAIGDTNTQYPSYGVFQIRGLPGRPSAQELLNANFNVNYAHEMFESQGNWSAWTCSRR